MFCDRFSDLRTAFQYLVQYAGLVHLLRGEHSARLPVGEYRIVIRDASYRQKIRLPPEPLDWRVFGDYGYNF